MKYVQLNHILCLDTASIFLVEYILNAFPYVRKGTYAASTTKSQLAAPNENQIAVLSFVVAIALYLLEGRMACWAGR